MTNGYLINKSILELFKKYPPLNIEITIYGMSNNVFQAMTSTSYSYEKVLSNIRKLKEIGARVNLKSVITRVNCHEIDLYKRFARQVGSKFRFDMQVNHSFSKTINPVELMLEKKAASMFYVCNTKKNVGNIKKNRSISQISRTPVSSNFFSCNICRNSVLIDPSGNVYPCLMVRPDSSHNIMNKSMKSIHAELQSLVDGFYRKRIKCDKCMYKYWCSYCEGIFYMCNNTEKNIDYYCNIAMANYRNSAVGAYNGLCETKIV
jgi:radical SAM protein with 4Fe4S-binding SPASM domain